MACEKLQVLTKQAFDRIDTDHDGKLSKKELSDCIAALEPGLSETKSREIVDACNPAGDDITFEQLKTRTSDTLAQMLIFMILDTNGDKRIDYSEFRSMTETVIGSAPNEEQLKTTFGKMDKNGDGMISLSEMLALE